MELLPLLFVLGICSSLALGNGVKTSPPEDLDGSGDDEDFSGSGAGSEDSKDVEVLSTPVAPLVPTVTQLSTAPKLDVAFEDQTDENVTQHMQTTTPHEPTEDLAAFHPVGKEPFMEEGTTVEPTSHQTSAGESVIDVKKHHHHHHHHTTLPVTSVPAEVDVIEKTTKSPAEDEKHFVPLEETTTSTPDEGNEEDLAEVMPTPEDSVNVHIPETTSGLTSTSSAHEEETTAEPSDIVIPGFVDTEEKTTVKDDSDKHHHSHHHPHHTTTTVSTETPWDGSDTNYEAETTEYLGPEEDQDQQGEATTTPPSDHEIHDHYHKHHHHHTTTPGGIESVTEKPTVHTHEPKGRKVNVPPVEATTVIPVPAKDEEPVVSTVQYAHPFSPTQDDDTPDSTEDESGDGSVEDDIFFEATAPVDKSDRIAPATDDGSSGASHGIMERKELLAGIIAGGIAGLVFAASLVAFVFYRMKKKDEGSYSLEEPKQSNGGYQKPREQREFYA